MQSIVKKIYLRCVRTLERTGILITSKKFQKFEYIGGKSKFQFPGNYFNLIQLTFVHSLEISHK